jgi:hypothetical protein
MKLVDYLKKRGITTKELSRRLSLTEATLRKAQKTPAPVMWHVIIKIVEGTDGIVTANDLLGISTRRPNYRATYE